MKFRWIEWNLEHIARHGVGRDEAELVIQRAQSPFPQQIGDEKLLVQDQGHGGRFLQVIYVLDPDDTVFVIHARPLTSREKKRLRRRKR